jgi:hypothetical protein
VSGIDWDVNFVVVPLALGFGALLAEVVVPTVYCMVAAAIQVADCIGLSVIQRNFFRAREGSPDDFDYAHYEFYLYRFQFLQRTLKLLGFMSALTFAVAAQFSHKRELAIASSILVIVTIVAGESVMAFWRHQLDSGDRAIHKFK